MTQDEIIRMAREAGLQHIPIDINYPVIGKAIERFAALVAADLFTYDQVKAHIQAAVISEREACAEVCDRFAENETGFVAEDCAAAIRARGKK